jgi:hypothetical protein
MENLDFGGIAAGAVIVGAFNLVIIMLTKTETILKVVERIKGVIRLDYRSRAKRSADELRIAKKHASVANERVRQSFVTMKLWRCRWTWNWSENFEPINIKGYCLGDVGLEYHIQNFYSACNHPVAAYYTKLKKNVYGRVIEDAWKSVGVFCTKGGEIGHEQQRAEFDVTNFVYENLTPDEAFEPMIAKAILSERDLRIANEIKKLRLQFWR